MLNAFLITGSGVVTETELASGIASRAAMLLQHPDARVFHDYSAITKLEIASNTFLDLAAKDHGQQLPLRRAVLVSDTYVAGIFRFILGPDAVGSQRTFYQRDHALLWLNEGLPPDKWIA